jgi:hypothetical protein
MPAHRFMPSGSGTSSSWKRSGHCLLYAHADEGVGSARQPTRSDVAPSGATAVCLRVARLGARAHRDAGA